MFKETRELINARQRFCIYKLNVVPVTQLGGGIPNDCFENAFNSKNRARGIGVVSGWVVSPYDASNKSTEIIQHWWNADSDGKHFDTTPFIGKNWEYIVDMDICEYGQQHYDDVDSCVASSLLLKDGRYFAVSEINFNLQLRLIDDLSTENLFRDQLLLAA